MKKPIVYKVLFALIFVAGGVLRLTSLDLRPMHTDEAVHAVKFGLLLEKGEYLYDKHEYHGPLLNYVTLIPAYLSGSRTLKEINEITLRIVPAIFGSGIILLLLLLYKKEDLELAIFTAVLIVVSPSMVYYSRYYIMEILLVFLSLGFIASSYRYLQKPSGFWALSAGSFLGFMHATKETCIISIFAMIISLVIIQQLGKNKSDINQGLKSIKILHAAIFIIAGFITSIVLFSSFFSNPDGIIDSFTTYIAYFDRTAHKNIHIHPWYYYFKILTWTTGPGSIVWSEFLVLFLAAFGVIKLLNSQLKNEKIYGFMLFIAIYTIILAIIYSLIPYKTPWNLLQFHIGFLILAGYGFRTIMKVKQDQWKKAFIVILLSGGMIHMVWQSLAGNYKYFAEPHNPNVYAHTSVDIFGIVNTIRDIAAASQDKETYIEVICPESDYWPLPWYLRDFSRIGWYSDVDMKTPPAPIIISMPELEPDILKRIYELPPPGKKYMYVPLFKEYVELRPVVELRGYVRKDLWDIYKMK